jgi:predicted metal-dependent phosphoesterase TrpH
LTALLSPAAAIPEPALPVYDLHTHSTASDGTCTPAELVLAAAAAGIDVLALSDHDTTAGLAEAATAAAAAGIRLIPAVEVSATWKNKTLHVIGLNIDSECPDLQAGLARLRAIRDERAWEIGRRLEKEGIPGAFEAAQALAGGGMITRTHFARHLASLGLAVSVSDVFNRYLGHGQPGYVATRWAELGEAIAWIRAAGGFAVIAHPQRYKLTAGGLRGLCLEFRNLGGVGLEVVAGQGGPGDIDSSAAHARRAGLLASVGSDFHSPDLPWLKLGRLPPLPPGLDPVWRLWERQAAEACQ